MELLKKLYSIYSGSRNELPMREFIKEWVGENVACATIVEDETGNIMVTKGESESYPCLASHTDQVQRPYPDDYEVMQMHDVAKQQTSFHATSWSRYKETGNSVRCGLGADDKNGIWVALRCLEKYDVLKCAFFVGEEIGCYGSKQVDMSWFDDCRWVAQIDRRGATDFITDICGRLCSDEFILDAIDDGRFGRVPMRGAMTDTMTLRDRGLKVSSCNMSCGYYNPHTEEEYTVWEELVNTLLFVEHLIEDLTDVYELNRDVTRVGWDFQRGIDTLCNVSFGIPRHTSIHEQQEEEVEILCYDVIEEIFDENAQDSIDVDELAKYLYDKNGKQFGYVPLKFYKETIEQVFEEFAESEAYFGMCEEE